MVFLSCDWGSTTFRLRALEMPTGRILRERRSDRGSSGLTPAGTPAEERALAFARCLAEEIAAFGPDPAWGLCPLVASGMVTSAHGWRELPYAQTPLPMDGSGLVTHALRLPDGRPVVLVSGLTDGTDVMRGEECELLGLSRWQGWSALAAAGDLTVIMPGTHCKHVRLSAGLICGFRTFMTGELYALLRQHSVLRHSLPPLEPVPAPLAAAALRDGAVTVRELGLAAALFRVRTAALLRGLGPAAATAFLNGVLIGAEFAEGAMPGGRLVLAASEAASALYAAVIEGLGGGERLTVVPPAEVARSSALGHALVLSRQPGPDLSEIGPAPRPASPRSRGESDPP
jgi:2-dehydro-3-deoxygalactonokinase